MLRQLLILLLLFELLYASTDSFEIDLNDDVTRFLCDNDVTLNINTHDQNLIHQKLIQNVPDVATIGVIMHLAGFVSSIKTLENVGLLIENIGLVIENINKYKEFTSKIKAKKLYGIVKNPLLDDEIICPPNSPVKSVKD